MPELKPRRRPSRRSSQSIVTAILDAASELLASRGLDGMTTNAIAERAGVSVGSLYQYFPNKQAVCAGIAGRVNELLVTELRAAVCRDGSPEGRLDAAIGVICSVTIGSHKVRRALLEQVPRTWDEAGILRTEEAVAEVLDPLFEALAPQLEPADRTARQRVATFGVRGAVQALLLHSPEMLARDEVRVWMRQMVLAPLASDSPSGAVPC